jgi:hypothetical protein
MIFERNLTPPGQENAGDPVRARCASVEGDADQSAERRDDPLLPERQRQGRYPRKTSHSCESETGPASLHFSLRGKWRRWSLHRKPVTAVIGSRWGKGSMRDLHGIPTKGSRLAKRRRASGDRARGLVRTPPAVAFNEDESWRRDNTERSGAPIETRVKARA